jgi:hypothetical protein
MNFSTVTSTKKPASKRSRWISSRTFGIQAGEFGVDQFAEHTGHNQTAVPGRFASTFFVHQQHIGLDLAGERDGRRSHPRREETAVAVKPS